MRFTIVFISLLAWCAASAQLYVLKDHRPDSSARFNQLYDSLPELCDSFYVAFHAGQIAKFEKYVPQRLFLKSTFDTLQIDYRAEQVVFRQQMILRNLQKSYLKIQKKSAKDRLRISTLLRGETKYDYGIDDKENEFCYVTILCTKRKHTYEVKFVAIKLNGYWFVGDELSLEEVE